jgi:hypothetical protein
VKRFRSRRKFLFESCGGISGLGLALLLDQDGLLAAPPVNCAANSPTARKPHFKPRAKSVISLFMSGGVSHVDTFDPKPAREIRRAASDWEGRYCGAAGQSWSVDAQSFLVPQVRPKRNGYLRNLSQYRVARR